MSNWKKAMMASAGGGDNFFFASQHMDITSQTTLNGLTVGCDNDGNSFFVVKGYDFIGSPVGASYQLMISKFDVDGNHVWSRGFFPNNDNIECSSIDFDSSNNIYIAGRIQKYWTNNNQGVWGMVINSSGTKVVDVSWQEPGQGTLNPQSVRIRHTGSGNFSIMAGFYSSEARMQNYSNTGTRNWAYKYLMKDQYGNTRTTDASGMDFDGTYHWMVGQQDGNYPFICRISSNGAGAVGSRYYGFPTGRNAEFFDVSAKGSDLKLVGYTENASYAPVGIYYAVSKTYNATGVLGGFTYNVGGNFNDRGQSVDTDSAGNTYLSGFGYEPNFNTNYGSVSYHRTILKVDSSHSLDWARGFGDGRTNGHLDNDSIFVTNNDNFVTAVANEPTNSFKDGIILAKLPADGSYTGTYTNLTPKEFTYGDETSAVSTSTISYSATLGSTPTITSEAFNSGYAVNQFTLYSTVSNFDDYDLISLS